MGARAGTGRNCLVDRAPPRAGKEAVFIDLFSVGTLEVVELTSADYVRVAELIRAYADFPLGTVDASVVAVAERMGLSEIATLDQRHFSVVRPKHRLAFTLLP